MTQSWWWIPVAQAPLYHTQLGLSRIRNDLGPKTSNIKSRKHIKKAAPTMTINTDDTRQTTDNSLIYRILLINSWEGLEYTPVVLRNDSPDASSHPSTQSTPASPQRIDLRSTNSSIHKVPKYNTRRAPKYMTRFPKQRHPKAPKVPPHPTSYCPACTVETRRSVCDPVACHPWLIMDWNTT